MKPRIMVLVSAIAFALIGSAQGVLAESSASTVEAHEIAVPTEDYQLRVLEERIQVLRDKLLMHGGKLDKKASQEWHEKYDDLKATLNQWNDSIDGIH